MNPTQQSDNGTTRVAIAVSSKIREEIFNIVNKLNADENRGRLVKPEDVISVSLTRLTSADMNKILEATLTNQDRLERKFKRFCEENGPISKDEFLGKLLGSALTDDNQ